MGQNKVAYRKSASYVAWKCLKSSCVVGGVVGSYPLLSLTPTPVEVEVEVELGCDNCIQPNIYTIFQTNIYNFNKHSVYNFPV